MIGKTVLLLNFGQIPSVTNIENNKMYNIFKYGLCLLQTVNDFSCEILALKKYILTLNIKYYGITVKVLLPGQT